MYMCEAILITAIATLGFYVTITDIQKGIIQNKALIASVVIGVIVNAVYLIKFVPEVIQTYLINLLIISVISIALYGFHFWAAGDSKLLICCTILFPARFYDAGAFKFAPGITALIFVFLIAYGYVIVDSVIHFFKKSHFFAYAKWNRNIVKKFILNFVVSFLYLRGIGIVFQIILGEFYYENRFVFSFLNIFLSLVIYNKKILKKWYALILVIAVNLLLTRELQFNFLIFKSYLILIAALFLRFLVSGYNYEEIPTENVKAGMVLAYPAILKLSASRIKNLPTVTTEDMSSRISQEEAEAIIRWKDSAKGDKTIMIVRKIPFAIFIVCGEICFFLIRVLR